MEKSYNIYRHKLLFLVFVSVISPKIDVRRAPVPEASICCTGEIAATGPLTARSPILPTCQTKKKNKTNHHFTLRTSCSDSVQPSCVFVSLLCKTVTEESWCPAGSTTQHRVRVLLCHLRCSTLVSWKQNSL